MIKLHCSKFSKDKALKDKHSSRVVNVVGERVPGEDRNGGGGRCTQEQVSHVTKIQR